MPRERPGMMRTLLADGRWVAISLVAAVIVFYAVRGKISHTATLTVPVEVEQEPGLAGLEVEPFAVRVTFRGAAPDLQQLGLRDMRVRLRPHVDNAAVGSGWHMRVRARDVQGRPAGARVVAVEPAFVRVLPSGGASPVEVTPREIAGRSRQLTGQSTRELRGVPVLAAAPPDRADAWRFDPPTVDVRVTGRAEVVQALAPESLLVVVDLRGVWVAEAEFAPVAVYLPPNVVVERIETTPATVFATGREN